MDSFWILVVATAILSASVTITSLYRHIRIGRLRSNHGVAPLGSLGWPFLGETIEFITCAYSDRPESFMNKRRKM